MGNRFDILLQGMFMLATCALCIPKTCVPIGLGDIEVSCACETGCMHVDIRIKAFTYFV